MNLFDDFQKAISQLGDRKFIWILGKSLLLSFVLVLLPFFAITGFLDWFLPETLTLPWFGELQVHGGLLSVAGIITIVLLSFLMFPIASLIIGFFLEDISDTVEARFYPYLPAVKRIPMGPMLFDALKFVGVLILANIVVLVFYLMSSVFAPLIFWTLNGYLLGREYFQLVAARRLGMKAATQMRKKHYWEIWMAGIFMAVPLSIPVINLIVPILGIAVFTHQFHRLNGDTPVIDSY